MKFYNNTNFICRFLNNLRETTEITIENHEKFIDIIECLDDISLNETNFVTKNIKESKTKEQINTTYTNYKTKTEKYIQIYKEQLRENNERLKNFHNLLINNTYQKLTPKKIWNVGKNLKIIYNLYTQTDLKEVISYIESYRQFNMDCLFLSTSLNKSQSNINKCKFNLSNSNIINIRNSYYPFLLGNDNIVKNDYDKKNTEKTRLITGPNASGKTTYIKSVLINLIFSQQLGLGFYSNAIITPQHQFYCYLTIPDTSGRDSLFQAEARRCLDIINDVESNKEYRHFAIFDELFSGTNTIEAVNTAYKYVDYMSQYNFTSLITTHFTTLVTKLLERKSNKNKYNCCFKMNVERNNNDFMYLYTISRGINKVQGALKVLQDLNFPNKFYE
jgi:DNA mismatch repair ATPase MutS